MAALVVVASAALVVVSRDAAGGMWAYPLDDAYIHLEVAWQLVTSGTWGINPGEPASASSSPLWTLLLAATLGLVGQASWLPLVLGVVAAAGSVFAADRVLGPAAGAPVRTVALLVVAALTPLHVMGVIGMEHGLQILLTFLVVGAGGLARPAWGGDQERAPSSAALAALAALCATRIEGAFLAAAWAVELLVQRRAGAALRVGLAAAAPIVGFGLVSVALGSPPLPNGLLMKSVVLGGHPLDNVLENLQNGLPALLPALLVWAIDGLSLGRLQATPRARILLGATLLHLGLAGVGWYYRYEAWLVAWGVMLSVVALRDGWAPVLRGTRRWPMLVVGVLLLGSTWTTVRRAVDATRFLPSRVIYIADAKVKLARALAQVDPDAVIALHDIGAMAWETELVVFDTAGLGSNDVLRLSRSGQFTGATIAELAASHHATLALGTASWMDHDPPVGWKPAARLRWGLDEVRVSEPIVAYAIAPGSETVARAWLETAVKTMHGRGRVEVPQDGEWLLLESVQ